jgi:hypothetical protein
MSLSYLALAAQGSQWCYRVLLLTLITTLHWQLFPKSRERYKKIVVSKLKYVAWGHGLCCFAIMYLLEPRNLKFLVSFACGMFPSVALSSPVPVEELSTTVKFSLLFFLAALLWDFGIVHEMPWKTLVSLNCHHLGAFIAMGFGLGWQLDQASNTLPADQAHLDSCLFGWLWSIHSFGFLLEVILPIFGVKLQEGERSRTLDVIKHLYAVVSVVRYYQYFNAPSQPGFCLGIQSAIGFGDQEGNYQSYALTTMLLGRFLTNENYKNVDFLRRIEIPGFLVVFFDSVLGLNDPYCGRAIGVLFALVFCLITHLLLFKKVMPLPETYFPPAENQELREFLEKEKPAILYQDAAKTEHLQARQKKQEGMKGFIQPYWKGMKGKDGKLLSEKAPIFDSIIQNDVDRLAKLLDELEKDSATQPAGFATENLGGAISGSNQRLTDWFNSTPLSWAVPMGYSAACAVLLLERGGDPYLKDDNGTFAVELGMKDQFRCGTPGAFGGSDPDFWDTFHKICLKKSPCKEKPWHELSMSEKLKKLAQDF